MSEELSANTDNVCRERKTFGETWGMLGENWGTFANVAIYSRQRGEITPLGLNGLTLSARGPTLDVRQILICKGHPITLVF